MVWLALFSIRAQLCLATLVLVLVYSKAKVLHSEVQTLTLGLLRVQLLSSLSKGQRLLVLLLAQLEMESTLILQLLLEAVSTHGEALLVLFQLCIFLRKSEGKRS